MRLLRDPPRRGVAPAGLVGDGGNRRRSSSDRRPKGTSGFAANLRRFARGGILPSFSQSLAIGLRRGRGINLFQAPRFIGAPTAFSLIAGAFLAVLFSVVDSRAQTRSGSCED